MLEDVAGSRTSSFSPCLPSPSPNAFPALDMDIGGLTTVVANSAYINARGSIDGSNPATARDKKYHARLKLPHITVCEGLRDTLDLAFDSVCVEQPIGKRLFREFLEANKEYLGASRLWKDIEDYDMAEDSDRAKKASKIVQRYMDPSAKHFCPYLPEGTIAKVKENLEAVGDDFLHLSKVVAQLHKIYNISTV
uniref:RGS domain-containing protein n=1 Tax=Fundulus heteroclitus TaxID=8078 RepID=A0A3Q2QTM5_FUNHE